MTTAAPTLADRKAATEAELMTLERAQAVAILDGLTFDARRLVEVRQELDGLDAAEAEFVRRERAAESAEKAQERAEARKALAGSLDDYLAAVERCEESAKALVADLQLTEKLAAEMRAKCRVVGGAVLPLPLEESSLRTAHSIALATKLTGISGKHHYGALEWRGGPPIPDWSAHARKSVAGALKPFLGE